MRVVGCPVEPHVTSILESMEIEHTQREDSDLPFDVRNYGTTTTSRIEWTFVTDPVGGLEKLGLDEWPGAERDRKDGIRQVRSIESFDAQLKTLGARLVALGEQPLSLAEFCALRCYTGPLYVKYNGSLRAAASGVQALQKAHQSLCRGNNYVTTVHVLSAAITKLGKLEPAELVYRAPGGALPKSFWSRQPEGMQGGIEVAFMSTTTAKEEAMAYARRAPGMILFEIHQVHALIGLNPNAPQ